VELHIFLSLPHSISPPLLGLIAEAVYYLWLDRAELCRAELCRASRQRAAAQVLPSPVTLHPQVRKSAQGHVPGFANKRLHAQSCSLLEHTRAHAGDAVIKEAATGRSCREKK